jgi:hypothetical protein
VFVAASTFTQVRSGADGSLLATLPAGGTGLEVVGDVDRDGVPDLAVGTDVYSSSSQQIVLRLVNRPIAAGDVDGDGHADLWLPEPAGVTLLSPRLGVLRVLPWPRGIQGASLAAGIDWNNDGVGDLAVGTPGSLPSGLAAVISGADGRELYARIGDRANDGFGATVALLRAPAPEPPSFAVSAARGGPLETGYGVLVRPARNLGGRASYGAGCVGAGGVPRLAWVGRPRIGSASSFTLAKAAATTAGAFLLGTSEDRWLGIDLPQRLAAFGMAECVLHAAPDIVALTTTDNQGRAALPLGIPNALVLVGARLAAQTMHLDPSANPGGVTTSTAVRLVIGR